MIRILLLKSLLLSISVAGFCQTNEKNDQESFRDRLKSKEAERKKSVVEYADKHSIPITGTGLNGEFMYLHHITNDRPVYYSTRGELESTIGLPAQYIKIGDNAWMPIGNDIKLQKLSNAYLFIKSDENIINLFIIDGDGKYYHKSKNLGVNELMISIRNMVQAEYILSIKTKSGLHTYNIFID